jgi:hypothetical protein
MLVLALHAASLLSEQNALVDRYNLNLGNISVFVETADGLASENLGLLVLVFNGSRSNFIA